MTLKRRFIISGGGSGGHVFPAIAIANALCKRVPDAEILFVGARDKLEMKKVPKAGYEIEGLWISGLQRSLTWKNLMFPLKLISSLVRSRSIIRRFKPDAAIGVGGYASGPLLRMAAAARIPTLIQEQNSYAGLTNKWLAKRVDCICVAYPDMQRFFPSEKIVLTGNPVRTDLSLADREKALNHFSLELRKKTILVTGGSLGARTLNEALRGASQVLQKDDRIQIIWQTGSHYYAEYSLGETSQLSNVRTMAFVDRMDYAYACADLVVCRAGAMTISELAILAKAAILIPSPNVAEDHQSSNAKVLVEKDAALLVTDTEAISDLIPTMLKVIHDNVELKKLERNIAGFGHADATERIVEEILNV